MLRRPTLLSLALVGGLLTSMPVARADQSEPADAYDAASERAVSTGSPVAVTAATTETSVIEAQPDGSFVGRFSPAPVRTLVNGEWTDLDPSLVTTAGGNLTPRVGLGEVSISNGGPIGSPLVTIGTGGDAYSLLSPVDLPTPTVTDGFAVYSEVLDEVDLVVKSTESGFTYNWVVKSSEAAANEDLAEIVMPVESDLEPVAEAGGVSYRSDDGLRELWTPTPTMWDSSADEGDTVAADVDPQASVDAVGNGPDQGDQVAPVGMQARSDRVVLTPDQDLLDDPDTVFPVVIDPTVPYDKYRSGWTAVWNNMPSHSFWQTDHSLGAGYEGYEQFKVVRSYFRFPTEALQHKHIISAEMNVLQIHAASCQNRPTQVYRTGAISTSTTWNRQPSRLALQDTNSATTGCGSGQGYVGWDVTGGVAAAAQNNLNSTTFMVRAQNESDKIAWKQFDDYHAELSVRYVSKPDVPKNVRLKVKTNTFACNGTSADPDVVGFGTVTALAKLTTDDDDRVDLRGRFSLTDVTTSNEINRLSGLVKSGDDGDYAFDLQQNHKYKLVVTNRVEWEGGDETLFSKDANPCFFVFDKDRPSVPTIKDSAFSGCSPGPCLTAYDGGAITVGFDPADAAANTDVIRYEYQLDNGPWTPVPTTAGADREFTVVPTEELTVLRVQALDAIGPGEKLQAELRVNPLRPQLAWTFDDPTAPQANSGQAGATGDLTLAGTTNPVAYGREAGSLALQGGSGTTGQSVSTTDDFTVSTWVRLQDRATPVAILTARDSARNVLELGYDGSQHWTLGRRDSNGVPDVLVNASGLPGVWTHLLVTFDATTKKARLYVNGHPQAAATFTGAWGNSSGWQLGCGATGAGQPSCMAGHLDSVKIFPAALVQTSIDELADPVSLLDNNRTTGRATSWSMTEPGTPVGTPYGTRLTLSTTSGLASGVVSTDGYTTSPVLKLPGTTAQQVRVAIPPADSGSSYTLHTRVRLQDATKSAVIAQQRGASRAAWTLAYRYNTAYGGRWSFHQSVADEAGSGTVTVKSGYEQDLSAFTDDVTHLTVVYDARANVIRLYVNGDALDEDADPAVDSLPEATVGDAWMAAGPLDLGNGVLSGAMGNPADSPMTGEMDYFEVRAGASDPNAFNSDYDPQD